MIADFHRRNVRVLFPVMLWDQGTRDVGRPESRCAGRRTGGRGSGWCQRRHDECCAALNSAARRTRPAIRLPLSRSICLVDEPLAYNNMKWGRPFLREFSFYRPVEDGRLRAGVRRQVQMARAAAHGEHLPTAGSATRRCDLQYAFFNGVGMETWENIWGIWNGITPTRRGDDPAHREDRTEVLRRC